MIKIAKVLLLTIILTISGCGGGGGDSDNFTRIKFIHASPGSGGIAFVVDGQAVAALNYRGSASYVNFNPGSHRIALIDNLTGDTLNSVTASFDKSVEYTAVAANSAAEIEALVFTDENIDPDFDNVRFRNLNLSPTAGAVDFYVLKDDSSGVLSSTPTDSGLGYSQSSGYTQRDRGTYVVSVTQAGQKAIIAQSANTVLDANKNFSFYLIENSTGGSPFEVLVVKDED